MKNFPSRKVALLALSFALVLLLLMLYESLNPREANARETVLAAAKLLERHSISSSQVSWKVELERAIELLGNSPRHHDVVRALRRLILATGEKHTLYLSAKTYQELISSEPAGKSSIGSIEPLDSEIPIIRLERYMVMNAEVSRREATAFRMKILRALEDSKCGVIVDLTRNTGGNLYAMLEAIAPLLPSTPLGYHLDNSGVRAAIVTPEGSKKGNGGDTPIAVISGSSTGSSGEYTLVALRSAAKVRTFGKPTAGLTTGNVPFELPNGGAIAITTSRLLDSRGMEVTGAVEPDQFERDYGSARHAAAAWLRSLCVARQPASQNRGAP